MKRMFWICLFVLGLMVSWSVAYADGEFYVIAAGKKAKRTVLVSPKSTAAESGTALLHALSKITDASVAMPYLIIIEPGIYDIGSSALQMKSYVDIQGSGENVTKITGTIDTLDSGVVTGANNAEIRFLTIENTGGGEYAIGFYTNMANALMTHITSKASGATNNYGVRIYDSSPIMTNVTATASGGDHARGVFNESSAPKMDNVTAKASGATTANYGVLNKGCSAIMTNVTAKASGGGHARGVFNSESSSPVMNNVTAKASGATTNHGVDNYTSSPVMNNVTAEASGGSYSYGVINSTNANPVMTNVIIEASAAGTTNIGVYNIGSSTVKIDHSVITCADKTVQNDVTSSSFIAYTRLDGGDAYGSCTCIGVYDENYLSY